MSDWTKIEKGIGTDTKIVKIEEEGSREMNWLDFGEVAWSVKEWTWQDLIIWIMLWTKIVKTTGDWTKVEK